MNSLVAMIIGSLVRTAVVAASSYLGAKGLADESTVNTIVGAAGVVGTGLWSIWQKFNVAKKLP